MKQNSSIQFLGEDNQYHIIYRTHNLINQKEYTGKHSTTDLNDGYYGSGLGIRSAIKKYGIENFAVEIMSYHDMQISALNAEAKIVDEEYVDRSDTYNREIGGNGQIGNNVRNKTTVKDKDGNTMLVSVNDPRYLSGELVGVMKDTHNPGMHKGKTVVKDKYGKQFHVSVDDPRFLSGELVGINKNIAIPTSKDMTCQYCGKIGKSRGMLSHIRHCKNNPNRIHRCTNRSKKSELKTCIYCNKQFRSRGYAMHIKTCKNSL